MSYMCLGQPLKEKLDAIDQDPHMPAPAADNPADLDGNKPPLFESNHNAQHHTLAQFKSDF